MRDETLIEGHSVPEIYVDGFTNHMSRDGVMTCVGFRKLPEGNFIVVRLAWPVVNTLSAISDATEALNAPASSDPAKRIASGVH
jgi:hypothetical protein